MYETGPSQGIAWSDNVLVFGVPVPSILLHQCELFSGHKKTIVYREKKGDNTVVSANLRIT